MPNIKELAAKAGVSPSTASIVVNGKSKERFPKKHRIKYGKQQKKLGIVPISAPEDYEIKIQPITSQSQFSGQVMFVLI